MPLIAVITIIIVHENRSDKREKKTTGLHNVSNIFIKACANRVEHYYIILVAPLKHRRFIGLQRRLERLF